MKTFRGVELSLHYSWPRQYKEVSGQLDNEKWHGVYSSFTIAKVIQSETCDRQNIEKNETRKALDWNGGHIGDQNMYTWIQLKWILGKSILRTCVFQMCEEKLLNRQLHRRTRFKHRVGKKYVIMIVACRLIRRNRIFINNSDRWSPWKIITTKTGTDMERQ